MSTVFRTDYHNGYGQYTYGWGYPSTPLVDRDSIYTGFKLLSDKKVVDGITIRSQLHGSVLQGSRGYCRSCVSNICTYYGIYDLTDYNLTKNWNDGGLFDSGVIPMNAGYENMVDANMSYVGYIMYNSGPYASNKWYSNRGITGFNQSQFQNALNSSTNELSNTNTFKNNLKNSIINNISNMIDITEVFMSTSASIDRTFYLKTTFSKDPNDSNVVNYETMILKTVFNKELSVPYGTDYLIIDR